MRPQALLNNQRGSMMYHPGGAVALFVLVFVIFPAEIRFFDTYFPDIVIWLDKTLNGFFYIIVALIFTLLIGYLTATVLDLIIERSIDFMRYGKFSRFFPLSYIEAVEFLSPFILSSAIIVGLFIYSIPVLEGEIPFDYKKILYEVRENNKKIEHHYVNILRIELPDENTTYYFTKENHFAHPSVIIENKEGVKEVIKTRGLTSTERQKFDKWFQSFEQRQLSSGTNLDERNRN